MQGQKEDKIVIDGYISSQEELQRLLDKGYWLTNYRPGELSLFTPAPHSGSCGRIYGVLADRLGKIHDRWNYDVWERRRAKERLGAEVAEE